MGYIYIVTYVNKDIKEEGHQVSSTGAFIRKKDANQEALELRSAGHINVSIVKLPVLEEHSSLIR